jgi:hypothetical protein
VHVWRLALTLSPHSCADYMDFDGFRNQALGIGSLDFIIAVIWWCVVCVCVCEGALRLCMCA